MLNLVHAIALGRAVTLPPEERIERRKAALVRPRAGVDALLREDVLPGRMDIAQAPLQ